MVPKWYSQLCHKLLTAPLICTFGTGCLPKNSFGELEAPSLNVPISCLGAKYKLVRRPSSSVGIFHGTSILSCLSQPSCLTFLERPINDVVVQ